MNKECEESFQNAGSRSRFNYKYTGRPAHFQCTQTYYYTFTNVPDVYDDNNTKGYDDGWIYRLPVKKKTVQPCHKRVLGQNCFFIFFSRSLNVWFSLLKSDKSRYEVSKYCVCRKGNHYQKAVSKNLILTSVFKSFCISFLIF